MTELESKLFKGMPEEEETDRNMKEVLIDRRVDQYLAAVLHVLRTELGLSEDVSPLTEEQILKFRKSMSDAYSVDEAFYTDAQKEFLEKLEQEDSDEFENRTNDLIDYENSDVDEIFKEIAQVLGEKAIDIFRDMEKTDPYLEELKRKEKQIADNINDTVSIVQERHDSACERNNTIQDYPIPLSQKRIDQLERKTIQIFYVNNAYYTDTEKAYVETMEKERENTSLLSAKKADLWKRDLWVVRKNIAESQYDSLSHEFYRGFKLSDDNKVELSNQFKEDIKILEGIRKTFEKEEKEVSLTREQNKLYLQTLEGHDAEYIKTLFDKALNNMGYDLKPFFSNAIEHAKKNDVSFFNVELEKANKTLEDIAPLEALESELALTEPRFFKAGWDTNHKEDILVWNATNENEKPVPLINLLEDEAKRYPQMDSYDRRHYINRILSDNIVLFHEGVNNCTRLGRTDDRTTFSKYEFLPPNLENEPTMPNPPAPLSGWEKFKDGCMKLFRSRTRVGLAYDNAMERYNRDLRSYNDEMEERAEEMQEYKEESPLVNHYKSACLHEQIYKSCNVQTDMVAKIDLLNALKKKGPEWERVEYEKKCLKSEIEGSKQRSSEMVVDHDQAWKQLVEAVIENACTREDAMINGTYKRSDYELKSLIQNMRPEQFAEPQEAPKEIEPMKMDEKKNSNPQLG